MIIEKPIHIRCPHLAARMDEDAKKGVFHWDWAIPSKESMDYMSSLLGRQIKGSDSRRETENEIEEKLAKGD